MPNPHRTHAVTQHHAFCRGSGVVILGGLQQIKRQFRITRETPITARRHRRYQHRAEFAPRTGGQHFQ